MRLQAKIFCLNSNCHDSTTRGNKKRKSWSRYWEEERKRKFKFCLLKYSTDLLCCVERTMGVSEVESREPMDVAEAETALMLDRWRRAREWALRLPPPPLDVRFRSLRPRCLCRWWWDDPPLSPDGIAAAVDEVVDKAEAVDDWAVRTCRWGGDDEMIVSIEGGGSTVSSGGDCITEKRDTWRTRTPWWRCCCCSVGSVDESLHRFVVGVTGSVVVVVVERVWVDTSTDGKELSTDEDNDDENEEDEQGEAGSEFIPLLLLLLLPQVVSSGPTGCQGDEERKSNKGGRPERSSAGNVSTEAVGQWHGTASVLAPPITATTSSFAWVAPVFPLSLTGGGAASAAKNKWMNPTQKDKNESRNSLHTLKERQFLSIHSSGLFFSFFYCTDERIHVTINYPTTIPHPSTHPPTCFNCNSLPASGNNNNNNNKKGVCSRAFSIYLMEKKKTTSSRCLGQRPFVWASLRASLIPRKKKRTTMLKTCESAPSCALTCVAVDSAAVVETRSNRHQPPARKTKQKLTVVNKYYTKRYAESYVTCFLTVNNLKELKKKKIMWCAPVIKK